MKKYLLHFLIFFILITFPLSIFSQEKLQTNKSVYELIDVAFLEKNPEAVSNILSSYVNLPEFHNYEEYVLQKTRGLLLSNQLDLIQSMCMSIIDNNIDNIDAVNLYMTVEKSVAKRNARQKELQEQRKAEAEYVAAATEKEKESIRKDYNTMESESVGQTVFVSPITSKYYSNFTWSFVFNLLELGLGLSKETQTCSYGIGVMGDFFYRGKNISLGSDFFLDATVLNFAHSDFYMREFSVIPGLSFRKINEDFFFRIGYSQNILQNNEMFRTPTLGIAIKNITNEDLSFGFYADYYLGHLFNKTVNIAFGTGVQSSYVLGTLKNINLSLFLNIKESLFLMDNGIDSQTRITIGFGVKSNE